MPLNKLGKGGDTDFMSYRGGELIGGYPGILVYVYLHGGTEWDLLLFGLLIGIMVRIYII